MRKTAKAAVQPVKVTSQRTNIVPVRFQKPNTLPTNTKQLKERIVLSPDPVVAQLQETMLEIHRHKDLKGISIAVACDALVGSTTVMNILSGTTRRPHYSTCRAIFNACGYDLKTVKKGT